MTRVSVTSILLFIMLCTTATLTAGKSYYTPKKGSAERKSIMDAARVPIMQKLKRRVLFVVSTLRSDGQWAYLGATPLEPNGGKFKWHKTPLASDWKNDHMSDMIMVLLRKDSGRWKAVDHVIGPTDVHWFEWVDRYHLPKMLFSDAGNSVY